MNDIRKPLSRLNLPPINLQIRKYPPIGLLNFEPVALAAAINHRLQSSIAQADAELATAHEALQDSIAAANSQVAKAHSALQVRIAAATNLTSKEGR